MNMRIFIYLITCLSSATLSSVQISISLNHENLPAPEQWKLLNVRINNGEMIDIKKPQIFGISTSKNLPYQVNVSIPVNNITLTDQIHETTYQEVGQHLGSQKKLEKTRQWLITIPTQFSRNDIGITFKPDGNYALSKRQALIHFSLPRGSSTGKAQLLKEDTKILSEITFPN